MDFGLKSEFVIVKVLTWAHVALELGFGCINYLISYPTPFTVKFIGRYPQCGGIRKLLGSFEH